MKIPLFTRTKAAVFGWLFVLIFSTVLTAQTASRNGARKPAAPAVKVTQIDEVAFKKLLVPNGKPLLINFWATWCDPCREEFPDLVILDKEYKGKIDFITVSLDDPADIRTTVPKFLGEMKAEMPAYLLKTADESGVISSVSKDWRGGMPFTALYAPDGKLAYFREGKVVMETLRLELNKLLQPAASAPANDLYTIADFVKIKDGRRDEAIYFYENNWKIYRDEAKRRGVIDSYELIEVKSEKNGDFDLILITRYKGEEQFKDSEKNFDPILKELRPGGPALKNALKPEEFRQNLFYYSGRSLLFSKN